MAIDYSKLKKIREDLKLTQGAMADILGVPIRTYRSYEQGTRDVGTDMLVRICQEFGVSSDELLGVTNEAKQKVATINGRLVFMIPIYNLEQTDFESDFYDIMPEYFDDGKEAKKTIALKVCGESMFPKLENKDILIIRKQDHFRHGDIVVVKYEETNIIRRVIETRKERHLEAINPTYPPIDISDDLINDIQIIGVAKKVIKHL